MSGKFLGQLKKLDAEAAPGPWEDINAFTAHGAEYVSINDDYMTNLDAELIYLLRNNTQAIIELVEAAEKQNEWQLKHAVYDIYLAEAVHDALAKLKGDV
jgi:hypothetical protein